MLCLDARFGESRTVDLTYDDFGRKLSFKWASEATAEAISGAVTGFASSISDIEGALSGPSQIEQQKEEISRLKTQKELNELRMCEEIIEAGGFQC